MKTYAIYFFDGGVELIDENEKKQIEQAILAGQQMVAIHQSLINVKNISRIGYHSSSAEMIRQRNEDEKRSLPENKQKQLEEMKYRKACLTQEKTKTNLLQGGEERINNVQDKLI